MLPDSVIESAFKEHELKYVKNEDIPSHLAQEGWYSKNHVKDLNNGSYICVHLILGPGSDGKSIVMRNDRVRIDTKKLDENNYTFSSEWIDQEITKNSDPCAEFFNQLL
ncbi:hypothetical protein [Enterovibrio norvegicus]|uniref:hypothetical protein n=1 Tax=Enterovibrio norvegicus TaxID=188144 RepID=UPI000C865BEB|nr:hypothetical protein [Enterovibrio norvegicus]PML75707.1 hypothetical protein BCT69_24310 [Enterovibrio norvegicus]